MADRIKGITIEIDGDVTKLSKALKSVNSDLRKNQSTLKDVDKLLQLDPGNTALLEQKYKALGSSIESAKSKLETLKQAETQMAQGGQTGTAEWDALQREIVDTEQKLKSLNKEMKNFGSVSAQKVAAAGEKVKAVGDGLQSTGKSLLPVTAALTAVGAAGVASYAEVDKTMQLTNKTMGNTEKQAQLLNKAMKEAAVNSTFGMNDAATAALNFARAGLNAEQAASSLAPAMNLAAGEGGNLDTVSAGLVATINGFRGSFEDAGDYADVFATACNKSALDIDSLSSSMSTAAPVFAAAGYTVRDTALYMGVMANAGIEAGEAANALKSGLARLLPDAKGGAEAMDRFGWSILDSNGQMKDTVTIQRELHDAFAGLSEDQQIAAAQAMFGTNQYSKWLALINTAPESVQSLSASLQNCAGATDEMAEAMMSGFGGSLEKLKSSTDVLTTSIGEALAPTILQLAQFVQGLVDAFNSLSPAQQQIIVKIGLVVALLGPLLIILGSLLSSIGAIMTWAPKIVSGISMIHKGVTILGTGLKALWAIMMANPIILIIAVIAALVAAFIYLWNNCEGFRKFWINLWENIKSTISSAADFIKNLAAQAYTWGSDMITGFANGIWSAIGNVVGAVKNVAETIRRWLHFSVPDEGPLTDYESWMPDFMQGLATGIEKNRNVVQRAMRDVAGDMDLSPAGAGSGVGAPGYGARAVEPGSARNAAAGDQGRNITVILEVDRQQFGKVVFKANNEETQRYGVNVAGVNA